VEIRLATDDDWAGIWPIYRVIAAAGETYAIPTDVTETAARIDWMEQRPGATFVAVDVTGAVLGTARAYPNRPAAGSHVASASFMVDPDHSGRGTGRALGEHVIRWAREHGFRAIQFNAVVESNERAVALWQSLGFVILTTVPEAFAHPTQGYVGLHIMHRYL
jgi:L-amino acid N-acyltransferase YncA